MNKNILMIIREKKKMILKISFYKNYKYDIVILNHFKEL